MATTSEQPLRRDAERNRQRILDTAGQLFAERGLGVSLDEIARHAGVGVGTVYRRFPDKDQLIDALFEARIGEILAVATASLEISDPWEALVHFLERSMELQVKDRALKELLHGTTFASGGSTAWQLDEVQPQGKKRMSATEWLKGARLERGTRLGT